MENVAERVALRYAGRVVSLGDVSRQVTGHEPARAAVTAAPSAANLVALTCYERITKNGETFTEVVHAISLSVGSGEIVAIVGESGCGKSTIARTILGMHRPTEGRVLFRNVDIYGPRAPQGLEHHRHIQMVFQDPYASLSPRLNVSQAISEALEIHHLGNRRSRQGRVNELLDLVGLPRDRAGRRPAELSGGERQRVAIARALAIEPTLLICDEPVTALDVSVQATILNLLLDLRDTLGLTCLVIAHDLAVVARLADRVAVMHDGRIVECRPTIELFTDPKHDQTKALLAAIPGQRHAHSGTPATPLTALQ